MGFADVLANGRDNDHVLRPRARKPVHSQLSNLSRSSVDESHLTVTEPDSGMTRRVTIPWLRCCEHAAAEDDTCQTCLVY